MFLIIPLVIDFDDLKQKSLFAFAFFIYYICLTNFVLMLSTLFSTPKMAGEIGTFLMIIGNFMIFLVYWDSFLK